MSLLDDELDMRPTTEVKLGSFETIKELELDK